MMIPEARSFVSRHRKGLQLSQFKNQDFPIKEHWKPEGVSKLTVGTVYNSAYLFLYRNKVYGFYHLLLLNNCVAEEVYEALVYFVPDKKVSVSYFMNKKTNL